MILAEKVKNCGTIFIRDIHGVDTLRVRALKIISHNSFYFFGNSIATPFKIRKKKTSKDFYFNPCYFRVNYNVHQAGFSQQAKRTLSQGVQGRTSIWVTGEAPEDWIVGYIGDNKVAYSTSGLYPNNATN